MKKFLAALILVSAVLCPLFAEEAKQVIVVDAPKTWKVEFKGDKGMQVYTLTRKGNDAALLMFSRWPAPGTVKQIPEQIEALAEGFIEIAKDQKGLNLKGDQYKIEKIDGETFSGSFVKFEIEGGITQTMFMIGYKEGIWNGQFTGTKEQWAEALAIVKKLKKKG